MMKRLLVSLPSGDGTGKPEYQRDARVLSERLNGLHPDVIVECFSRHDVVVQVPDELAAYIRDSMGCPVDEVPCDPPTAGGPPPFCRE